MTEKNEFKGFIERMSSLDNEQSSYLLAVITLIFSLLASIFVDINIYLIPLFFILLGLFLWGLSFVEVLIETIIGKALGGIFLIAATAFNLAFASHIVNLALKVPASAFGYTHTIVAVFTVPFSVALISIIVSLLLVPFTLVSKIGSLKDFTPQGLILLKPMRNSFNSGTGVILGRFIATLVLLFSSIFFLQNNKPYGDMLSDFTRWFAYSFEMEVYSYCKLEPGTKISYISETKIITASLKGEDYEFNVETCVEE